MEELFRSVWSAGVQDTEDQEISNRYSIWISIHLKIFRFEFPATCVTLHTGVFFFGCTEEERESQEDFLFLAV